MICCNEVDGTILESSPQLVLVVLGPNGWIHLHQAPLVLVVILGQEQVIRGAFYSDVIRLVLAQVFHFYCGCQVEYMQAPIILRG